MPNNLKSIVLTVLLSMVLLGLGVKADDSVVTSGSSADNETTSSSNELAGFSQAVLKEEISKNSDNLESSGTQLQFTDHNTLHVRVDSSGTENFSEAGQTKTIKHFITWDEDDLFGYFCMGYLRIEYSSAVVDIDHVTSGAFSTGIRRRGVGWVIVDPWLWFSEDDVPESDPNRLAFTITWKALQAGTTTFAYTITNSSGTTIRNYFLTGTVHNMQAVPAVVDFAPQIQPPAAPGNLAATAVSSSQINLTWQNNADNEDGFIIESKTSCHDPFVQIAVVESNPEVPATTYSHTNLSPGTVHHYRVKAYNVAGNSAPSNMSAAVTFAHIPTIDENIAVLNNVKDDILKNGIYQSFLDRLNEAKYYLGLNDYKSALGPLNSIAKKLAGLTDAEMTAEARVDFGCSLAALLDYLTVLTNPTAAVNLYLYGYPCQNEIHLQPSGEQVITTSLTGDLSIELKPTNNPEVLSLIITRTNYTGTAFTLNNIDYGLLTFANNPTLVSSGTINLRTGQTEFMEKLWARSPYIDSTIGEPVSFGRVSKGTFYPIGLENGVIQLVSEGTMPVAFNNSPYHATSRMQTKKPETKLVIQKFEYVEIDNPREITITLKTKTGEIAKEPITEIFKLSIPVSGNPGGRANVEPNPIRLTIPSGENESEPITVIIKGTATSDQKDDISLFAGDTKESFTVIDMQILFTDTDNQEDDLVGVGTEQKCLLWVIGPNRLDEELIEVPEIILSSDATLITPPPGTVYPVKFPKDNLMLWIRGMNPSAGLNTSKISAKIRVVGREESITCILEEDFTVVKLDKIELVSGATMIGDGANTPLNTDVCAAIKDTGDVLVRTIIMPSDSPANLVTWNGGQEVSGQPLQRKVSKTEWAKHTVIAACLEQNYTMLVYIIGAEPTGFSPKNGTSGKHFSDNNAGFVSTGVFPPDPTTGAYVSRCEIEFTVKPDILITDGNANIFTRTQIQWDVSRDARDKIWRKIGGIWSVIIPPSPPPSSSVTWLSDDSQDTDEDNNPWDGNGHLYGNDEPGWAGNGQAIIDKMNMREWVRVGLGGVTGRNGTRCSEYYPWHIFRSIRLNGTWSADNTYGNEIALGNVFWGTVPIPELRIITTSLPDGKVGQAYSQTLSSNDGMAPITWSIDIGDLPPGLTLNASGNISGIPTTAGTFTFDVEVQDSNLIPGPTADIQTLSIRIKK